jgi:predicted AlkP superfamily pyrophosphatase or phosphodiesterase
MINQESIEEISRSKFSKNFVKPLYDSYCFSRIPASVSALLKGNNQRGGLPSSCFLENQGDYDMVVFFFLDAFGWKFFEKHREHPFCQRFIDRGVVSQLTSQFPSTTAAEVTTIHSGLEVGQTGIYEWFHYEPKVGRIIAPLLFSYAGDKVLESLRNSSVPVADFFPFETTYQKLHSEGVTSHVFQHVSLCSSPYSQCMTKEAHLHSYYGLKQGLQSIAELVNQAGKEKTYALFYYANIDATGHRKGVDSVEMDDEIIQTLDLLENEFLASLSKTDKKIAIMISADHGMIKVDPRKTLYINQECPKLASFIKKGEGENFLAPAGSCRDLFLHIKEESLDEAYAYLTAHLEGKAEVWKVSDLISLGLFGSHVSKRFLERVGDIVILPNEEEAVWWYEKRRFEQNFYGAHGGLSKEEQEIPFLFAPLDKLF